MKPIGTSCIQFTVKSIWVLFEWRNSYSKHMSTCKKRTFVSNLSSTLLFQNNTWEECQRSSWRTSTSRGRRNWSDSCSMLAILNLRTFGLGTWQKNDIKEETTENTAWKLHQIRWGAPGFHFLIICLTPLLSGREISSLQLLLVRCSHNYRTTVLL